MLDGIIVHWWACSGWLAGSLSTISYRLGVGGRLRRIHNVPPSRDEGSAMELVILRYPASKARNVGRPPLGTGVWQLES